MGRSEEGLRETRKALESDPLSLVINTTIGRQLYLARQYDQAVEQLRKVLDAEPKFAPARTILEGVYAQMGKQKEAVGEREKLISLSGGPELAAAIEQEFARSGYRGVVQSSLKGLTEMSKHEYVSPYSIAQAYMRAGDPETTLDWLEKAHDEHASGLVSLAADPMFDQVRSSPRFQEILRQMKFTQ
jgi:tetratricopeptide (TPR) repeat protein